MNFQPWFKKDIQVLLLEPRIVAVGDAAYVGIHIRRGDKLVKEATKHGPRVRGKSEDKKRKTPLKGSSKVITMRAYAYKKAFDKKQKQMRPHRQK